MSAVSPISPIAAVSADCYHCGLPCPDRSISADQHAFCCPGCCSVYEILQASGLQQYYALDPRPGRPPPKLPGPGVAPHAERFAYLDDEQLQAQLLDFNDGRTTRATLRLPQIHCASCVWLLENLQRLQPAVRSSEVDFLRRELWLVWDAQALTLRQLVEGLARIGYEPEITLGSAPATSRPAGDPLIRRIGVAGFCFGNAMLFSLPTYFANPGELSEAWRRLFTMLNLALALPVMFYSSTDYLAGAWRALTQRTITIDVPIALGICVLFVRSFVEILLAIGPGYFDSFNGFVFFLLLGRLFQRHSFVALSFERDYRSYFPLAVTVCDDQGEHAVAVAALQPGQRLIARHGELIPADSRLLSPHGRIDFSYVTGEADPVAAERNDVVWAGGRVAGGAIELEVLREVSQSYLTRLWNQELFHRPEQDDLSSLANRISRWFTGGVLLIASVTAAYWIHTDPSMALHAVASVLIVACPCALALSTPFTTGAALNLLARAGLFLRDGAVVERLARTRAVVLDKTGTLTSSGDGDVVFHGVPLSAAEGTQLAALLANSVHPLSRRIRAVLLDAQSSPAQSLPVTNYEEVAGSGAHAYVGGEIMCVGSRVWLEGQGVADMPAAEMPAETAVYVAIGRRYRGVFRLGNSYRSGVPGLLRQLRTRFPLYLLSGDNDRERERLLPLFGDDEKLCFAQSPQAKLHFVEQLEQRHRVLMVGDGLNDAGALKQSSVGITVSDDVAAFSPACDGILQADRLARLPAFLQFARVCLLIVASSFVLSLLYNVIGLTYAVSGALSPLVSALLMPISSVSVIAFTAISTRLAARWTGIAR